MSFANVTVGMQPDEGATLAETLAITAIPALCMAFGSMAVSLAEPSEKFQGRMQHLSAGILTGAIIADIFPILKKRLFVHTPGRPRKVVWMNCVAAVVGFFLALALMYSVKSLDLEDDDEDIDETAAPEKAAPVLTQPLLEDASEIKPSGVWKQEGDFAQESNRMDVSYARLTASCEKLTDLCNQDPVDRDAIDEEIHVLEFFVDSARRHTRGAEPIDKKNAERLKFHIAELAGDVTQLMESDKGKVAGVDRQLKTIAATLRHIHSHTHRGRFRRFAMSRPKAEEHGAKGNESITPAVPLALIFAVVIDSVVDGMLIGLAASVARNSGVLMSVATAIEMGFLGYSFACAVSRTMPCIKTAMILVVPPVTMLMAAGIAAYSTDDLEGTPMFVGLVAFALVALLFLVVQELLMEAHEKEGHELWQTSIWLYIGLLLSVGFDIVL